MHTYSACVGVLWVYPHMCMACACAWYTCGSQFTLAWIMGFLVQMVTSEFVIDHTYTMSCVHDFVQYHVCMTCVHACACSVVVPYLQSLFYCCQAFTNHYMQALFSNNDDALAVLAGNFGGELKILYMYLCKLKSVNISCMFGNPLPNIQDTKSASILAKATWDPTIKSHSFQYSYSIVCH